MRLDAEEIAALAEALAPALASLLAARFEQRPEWCFSIAEAAAWLAVDEHVIRHAVRTGRLPAIKIGNTLRIKRSDLFAVKRDGEAEIR